jgi:hypothetical protein
MIMMEGILNDSLMVREFAGLEYGMKNKTASFCASEKSVRSFIFFLKCGLVRGDPIVLGQNVAGLVALPGVC